MVPSLLTAFALNGSSTEATCGPAFRSVTRSWTRSLPTPSDIFPPSGARITTRAVAPSALAAGNCSSSRSNAFWDSVPGMEKESSGGAGAAEEATPAPTSRATHSRATRPRRRNALRPSR